MSRLRILAFAAVLSGFEVYTYTLAQVADVVDDMVTEVLTMSTAPHTSRVIFLVPVSTVMVT